MSGKQSSVHLQKHENVVGTNDFAEAQFRRTCGESSYTFKKKPFCKEYDQLSEENRSSFHLARQGSNIRQLAARSIEWPIRSYSDRLRRPGDRRRAYRALIPC